MKRKAADRPFSLGDHVESQENKKLCFCTASLTLNSRLREASRAEAFYSPETQHGRRERKVYKTLHGPVFPEEIQGHMQNLW